MRKMGNINKWGAVMIAKEKFDKMEFTSFGFTELEYGGNAYRLPEGHVLSNHSIIDLRNKISNLIHEIKEERGKSVRRLVEEDCGFYLDTYKKAMCGKGRTITRPFLARICVGLKLPIDKANELFRMQGGELNLTNNVDAITYYAILDKDSVEDYENELVEKAGVLPEFTSRDSSKK